MCQATAGNGERPHDVPGQPSCWCGPHIAAARATEKQPPASQGVRSRRTSVGGLLSVRRHTQDAPVSPRLQRRWAAVPGRRRTGRAMPAVHPACGGNCSISAHVIGFPTPPAAAVRLPPSLPPHGFACHGPWRRRCLSRGPRCASEPPEHCWWRPVSLAGWHPARPCDSPRVERLCSAEHARTGGTCHQRRRQATWARRAAPLASGRDCRHRVSSFAGRSGGAWVWVP